MIKHALYKTHVSVAHLKTNSDRNEQRTNTHDTEHERSIVLQFVSPCLSKVAQKTCPLHACHRLGVRTFHRRLAHEADQQLYRSVQSWVWTPAARLPPRRAPTCAYVLHKPDTTLPLQLHFAKRLQAPESNTAYFPLWAATVGPESEPQVETPLVLMAPTSCGSRLGVCAYSNHLVRRLVSDSSDACFKRT